MTSCPDCNRYTALVVEDDVPMRQYLAELLLLDGSSTRVLDAVNGAMALSSCAGHPPNLILLDLGLPDVAGLDLLVQLRRLAPDAVIVALSCTQPDRRSQSIAAGADACIEKFDVHRDLIPTVRRATLNRVTTCASRLRERAA